MTIFLIIIILILIPFILQWLYIVLALIGWVIFGIWAIIMAIIESFKK